MNNTEGEAEEPITNDEAQAISTELIAARVDIHDLLLVIRLQAYITVPLSIGYLLYVGKEIIIPIVISFVVTYVTMLLADAIESLLKRVKLIKGESSLPLALSLITIFLGSAIFAYIVKTNIVELSNKSEAYHAKLEGLIDSMALSFGLREYVSLEIISNQLHIGKLISSISKLFMYLFSEAFNIIIYTSFLLATWNKFHKVIVSMLKFKGWDPSRYLEIRDTVNLAMKEYIVIKIIVSLLTAVISYLIMLSFGLDFALFWGLLTFFLNFIPTIGSIVAALIPSLLGLLQFDPSLQSSGLAIGLLITQLSIGNILEPKLMGKRLNLNTFMIVVFLAVWGNLWGVIGMFLCIPIMVMMLLVFKEFEATGIISIALSGDGQIFSGTESTKGAKFTRQLAKMRRRLKKRKRLINSELSNTTTDQEPASSVDVSFSDQTMDSGDVSEPNKRFSE
jgi:AI-2 transport protein TqsA